jgi:hypothetical protein
VEFVQQSKQVDEKYSLPNISTTRLRPRTLLNPSAHICVKQEHKADSGVIVDAKRFPTSDILDAFVYAVQISLKFQILVPSKRDQLEVFVCIQI